MKKRRNCLTILIVCFVLAFESVTIFAAPTTDEEINNAKDERDKKQKEYDEVKASIDELSKEAHSVQDEIDEVSSALVQVMAEIEVLEADIDTKEQDIVKTEEEYEIAVEKERAQYEAMKVRIKYLYEDGNKDLLQIYLESGDILDALNKEEYVEAVYAYDRKMLSDYQNTVILVDELHTTLIAEKEELENLKADYEEEQSYMEEVMDELQTIADDYYTQIAEAKVIANDYAAQIKKQNKEIKNLEDKKRREEEEAKRKAEEEARRKAEEEARKNATEQVANVQNTGVVTTTNNVSYDVSSIYSANGSDLGKSIAAFACQYIGNPYVPGGTSLTNGADCSGFVFAVYKSFGYTVPRTSTSLRGAGTEVSLETAQPGDVVCYPGHVGLYIGNGMIVHASTQKTGIKVSNAQYRSIICIRRII